MDHTFVFYCILVILIGDFMLTTILNHLNAKKFGDPIPEDVQDVYSAAEYKKSQEYKRANYRFGIVTSVFSLVLIVGFLVFGGFGLIDSIVRDVTKNEILQTLLFFWNHYDW